MIGQKKKKGPGKAIAVVLILLVLLVGGLFFLSGQAGEVPMETIEEEVSLGDGEA
ncbi:hypothetical protein [Sphingomicrobium sediminis]|uniref:Uncharacterized protein n=1 Tax=Sphingomicrobium sediminis TaxID=2950949 RepID=A0A9X2EF34_9SPHN|nr:hypothetical protein [Sphingomicrobium sediminis]MCM8556372.1 hypothetical protein [Sphingomicrobium sediminis]